MKKNVKIDICGANLSQFLVKCCRHLEIVTSTEKTLETTFFDAYALIKTTAGKMWLTK